MTNPRYPIGEYEKPASIARAELDVWVEELKNLPSQLEKLVANATEDQLATPYREGGWAIRQVVHHIADAYMNSFIHFKLALNEENPTIKPYDEEGWSQQADNQHGRIEHSIHILKALLARWGLLLDAMQDADFQRTFVHPSGGQKRLDEYLSFCVWHGKHHMAHIAGILG